MAWVFLGGKYVVSSSILFIQIPAKGHLTCNSDQIHFDTLVYPADPHNKIGKLLVCTCKDSLLPNLIVLSMINNLQILNLLGHFRLDTQFLLETQLWMLGLRIQLEHYEGMAYWLYALNHQMSLHSVPIINQMSLKQNSKKLKIYQCCTGGPPLTQKSLTRFPLPWFLAYVLASGGFPH